MTLPVRHGGTNQPPHELPGLNQPERGVRSSSFEDTAGRVTCGGLCPGFNDVILVPGDGTVLPLWSAKGLWIL